MCCTQASNTAKISPAKKSCNMAFSSATGKFRYPWPLISVLMSWSPLKRSAEERTYKNSTPSRIRDQSDTHVWKWQRMGSQPWTLRHQQLPFPPSLLKLKLLKRKFTKSASLQGKCETSLPVTKACFFTSEQKGHLFFYADSVKQRRLGSEVPGLIGLG